MKLTAAPLVVRLASATSYVSSPLKRRRPSTAPPADVPEPAATKRPHRTSRLCNTFFLAMPADEAHIALKNLTLERFSLEFAAIPATGGCVVAVYAPTIPEPDFFLRFRIARQQHDIVRLMTSLGATAV